MTREEAIRHGYEQLEIFGGEHYEFIKMAIKALEQEPCLNSDEKGEVKQEIKQEPCEDAISRDAVHKLRKYVWVGGIQTVSLDDIDELPSVTPSRHKGRWIKIQSGDKDFPESIVCSRCGNENSHLDFNENAEPIGKVFVTSNFCPNCGAKMFEPQERSDKE